MIQRLRQRVLDSLVLRPSRDAVDFGTQQRVMLNWGPRDEPLECFSQHTGDPENVLDLLVVKFPGTAGRAERSTSFPAGFFDDANAQIWTWNPPGYGRSGGRASLARISEAAAVFWSHTVNCSNIDASTRIWIVGNSLGCATALRVAMHTNRQRLGMILRNPPPLSAVVKHVAKRYPLGSMIHPVADSLADDMNAIVTAGKVDLPGVFLQSQQDELVPPAMQQSVIDAYAGPLELVVLEGLSHGGVATEYHEPFIRDALQWLWDQTSDGN